MPQLFHSAIDGHSYSSQFLAFMNYAAVNALVHVFWQIYAFMLGIYLGVGFLVCGICIGLALVYITKQFSKVVVPQ